MRSAPTPRVRATPKTAKPAPVTHQHARAAVQALANPAKARFMAGFFKTGNGEYAEGDRFLGVMVPQVRQLARQFHELSLPEAERLLKSPYNEERLLALLILSDRYAKGNSSTREEICSRYVENRVRVNNWNLVDSSAPYILGSHLISANRALLYQLVKSRSLWDRRIAVVATLALIRQNQFLETLELSRLLLQDREDLIHKACGWMLREVGKRNESVLEGFLKKHHASMPRTMLRYAIERFPEAKRKTYLYV